MKRRKFFNRLLGAAAVVALAPQLCFRVPPIRMSMSLYPWQEQVVDSLSKGDLVIIRRRTAYYSQEYLDALAKLMEENPRFKALR